MRGLAATGIALGCTALAAAGCGGGQSSPTPNAGRQALIQPAPRPATTPAPPPAQPAATPKPRSYATGTLAAIEQRALDRLRAFKAAQLSRRQATAARQSRAVIGAVRDLTEAVLVSSGLEFATYDVLDDGKTVVIDVARRDACNIQPSDQVALPDRIINASDVVEHVNLRLTPSGKLGPYIKANCHKPKALPAGLGATLLSAAHDGVFETKPFRVSRSRWTLTWSSSSSLLQIYVYKDGRLRSVAVNSKDRGSGTKTLSGSGTYTLRIAGTARWHVRVRDGAARGAQVATPESAPTSAP